MMRELKNLGFLRYYMVFNIEQCDGIKKEFKDVPELEILSSCEEIISGNTILCPEIEYPGSEAYYHPVKDIVVPERKGFIDSDHYYATLFHELVHSSGHKDRLIRKELTASIFF